MIKHKATDAFCEFAEKTGLFDEPEVLVDPEPEPEPENYPAPLGSPGHYFQPEIRDRFADFMYDKI